MKTSEQLNSDRLNSDRLNSQRLVEQQLERERIQDVLLLVQHLVANQETTFKLIIDCLYDIGSVTLINQKIKSRSLGRLTKAIASTSKPVFRRLAFYWVKRNCPRLITNWLYGKVTFGQQDLSQLDYPREVVAQAIEQYEAEQDALAQPQSASSASPRSESQPSESMPGPPMETQGSSELKRLQGQVKLLKGMLLGSCMALGGATVWIWHDMQPEVSNTQPSVESVESVTLEDCKRFSSSSSTKRCEAP